MNGMSLGSQPEDSGFEFQLSLCHLFHASVLSNIISTPVHDCLVSLISRFISWIFCCLINMVCSFYKNLCLTFFHRYTWSTISNKFNLLQWTWAKYTISSHVSLEFRVLWKWIWDRDESYKSAAATVFKRWNIWWWWIHPTNIRCFGAHCAAKQ